MLAITASAIAKFVLKWTNDKSRRIATASGACSPPARDMNSHDSKRVLIARIYYFSTTLYSLNFAPRYGASSPCGPENHYVTFQ